MVYQKDAWGSREQGWGERMNGMTWDVTRRYTSKGAEDRAWSVLSSGIFRRGQEGCKRDYEVAVADCERMALRRISPLLVTGRQHASMGSPVVAGGQEGRGNGNKGQGPRVKGRGMPARPRPSAPGLSPAWRGRPCRY